MTQHAGIVLEARKRPVQVRSTASVEALLTATVQVLLHVGSKRLTTTLVARRVGVSVGTLYQYFPNKSALLQAVLKRHLDEVAEAVELACREQHGKSLDEMATALVFGFLRAKLKDPKTSAALYAISSDVDGATIARQMAVRLTATIKAMLQTTPENLMADPALVASIIQGVMVGVSRRLLESGEADRQVDAVRDELIFLSCAYLRASCTRPVAPGVWERQREFQAAGAAS